MERIVKYRLATFYLAGQDPITGNDIRYPRDVTHGMRVSSDSAPDTPDPNTLYGVSEDEMLRVESINPGVFFSEPEIAAMEAGITDALGGQGTGDVMGTATPGIGRDPGTPGDTPHPLAFEQMTVSQVADYIDEAQPSADELIEILMSTPEGSREEVGNKILAAEAEASGGEPRDDVLYGVAEALGRGAGLGPEGSEGVEGTAPPERTGDDSGDGEEAPTEAAAKFAEEQDVDLSKVEGTGSGGRVTKPDIEKYLAERDK